MTWGLLAVAACPRAGVEPGSLVWQTLCERARKNPVIVANPRAEADRTRAELAVNRRRYAPPRIRAAVGGATVYCFGFEQGVLLANGLRYAGPPPPQGYQVNTPLTQLVNQNFYRGPRAPEFVVFKLQPMDGHPPTAENAGVDGGVLRRPARGAVALLRPGLVRLGRGAGGVTSRMKVEG